MTRDLDALVAEKVMGWKNKNYTDYVAFEDETGRTRFISYADGSPCLAAFLPSERIADAWMVVEKFIVWDVGTDGCLYLCKIKTHPNKKGHIASADTAPEAICLAALKAVGWTG